MGSRPMSDAYGIDTRRSEFMAQADLSGPDDLIDLMVFEAPESLSGPSAIGFLSHDDGLVPGRDVGWRAGGDEADQVTASLVRRPGERLVLAARAQALRLLVAEQRCRATPDGRVIDIPFSTTIAFPRGVQASARRRLSVLPIASAPAPAIRGVGHVVELDGLGMVDAVRIAEFVLALPSDLALLEAPSLLIECALEDTPALELALNVDPLLADAFTLERHSSQGAGLARWLLGMPEPRVLAGQRLRLDLRLAAAGLTRLVAGRAGRSADGRIALDLTTRCTGWRGGRSAGRGDGARLWRVNLPDMRVTLQASTSGAATVDLAGHRLSWRLDRESERAACSTPLMASYDLDAPQRHLHIPEVELGVSGWPVGRGATVEVHTALHLPDGREAGVRESLTLALNARASERAGRMAPALGVLVPDLLAALGAARRSSAELVGRLAVNLTARDSAGENRLTVDMPLIVRPRPRRFTICLDLGASGICAWSAPSAAPGQAGALSLAPLGTTRDGSGQHAILPATLMDAGEGEPAVGAIPPLPFEQSSLRFRAEDTGPSTISPRRRLMAGAFQAQGVGRGIGGDRLGPAALMADAVREVIASHLLPLQPGWRRPDDAGARLVPRLTLTYPEGLGGDTEALYRDVAAQLPARLDPLFPGSAEATDLVTLVGEGVAAARHQLSLTELPPTAGEARACLVAIDIGATAASVAVVEAQAGRQQVTAAFNLPLGGDTLVSAVQGVVCAQIEALETALSASFARLYRGPVALGLAEDEPAGRAEAAHFLRGAVTDAMTALSEAALRRAERTEATHDWRAAEDGAPAENLLLCVPLMRLREGEPPEGLFAPRHPLSPEQAAAPQAGEAPGAAWRLTHGQETRLELLLDPRAMAGAGPASAKLDAVIAALGSALPRMARSVIAAGPARPDITFGLSGRAALWPPLHAALAAAIESMGCRLAQARPLAPDQMKQAVSAGAAMLAAEGSPREFRPRLGPPLALAVSGVRLAAPPGGQARTSLATERLYYLAAGLGDGGRAYEAENAAQPSLAGRVNLGRRFSFARAAPGLDPNGRTIALWREAGGIEPLRMLAGDAALDAGELGLPAFGPCDITCKPLGEDGVRVSIHSIDTGWLGHFTVTGDMVTADGAGDLGQ